MEHSPSISKLVVPEYRLKVIKERTKEVRPGPADYNPESLDQSFKMKKIKPVKNLNMKLTLRLYDPSWDEGRLGKMRATIVRNTPGPLSYEPRLHKGDKPGTF